MERIDKIMNDCEYKENYLKIKQCEKGRKYCKHNYKHFLDVARIAYILNLEEGLSINKDIIYATALLHDIGKHLQYTDKIPHEKASANIAHDILKRAGYNDEEEKIIVQAILKHRDGVNYEKSLDYIIYKADKLSRNCFDCKMNEQCNWSNEQKNNSIIV